MTCFAGAMMSPQSVSGNEGPEQETDVAATIISRWRGIVAMAEFLIPMLRMYGEANLHLSFVGSLPAFWN